jgi:hypothetical protein
MMYPLVRELAEDGVPVTVTCRVLKFARQPHYRWLAQPVTEAEWVEAHRANALFDAHRDDPESTAPPLGGFKPSRPSFESGCKTLAIFTAFRLRGGAPGPLCLLLLRPVPTPVE